LFRYYIHGNLDHNPYLYDGDIIYLGTYHENRQAIQVTGDVASPGKIEYRSGDTVLDALRLVAGTNDLSDMNLVRLTRRMADGTVSDPVDLDVSAMQSGSTPAYPLRPGDHINLELKESASASIYGNVHFPGTFPIENGKTSLRDLIALAGDLKPGTNLDLAYFQRRSPQTPKPDADASGFDFFERAYFQQALAENRVPIDIGAALDPVAEDVFLYNGDMLVFPPDEQAIHVTGNAVSPGYLPYVNGQTARFYIEQAGGEAPLATGVYIFEAGTGRVHTDANIVLEPGDTIFINREKIADTPELQALLISDEASKRQTRIATTQTIITGITALVSVVNTFLLLRDRLGN
jgi:protein involved in polysaccharide export with SLBB domain